MDIAAISRAMSDLGYSDKETLALIQKLDEQRREKIREDNRARQQRHRDRVNNARNEDNARNEHNVNNVDNALQRDENEPESECIYNRARADGNLPGNSLRSFPVVTPLPTGGPQGGRSRGSRLPEDWTPSEELFAYGASLGMTRRQCSETFEDMRVWADANANRPIARKADWNKTAQGFLRRDAKKARAGPPQRQSGGVASLLRKSFERDENAGFGKAGTGMLEAARKLPFDEGLDRGRYPDDDGGISDPNIGLLVGNSIRRM